MVTVFVDTSALVVLLDADDARHAEARTTFEWLTVNAELVTTNYVEVEAAAVVDRRLGRKAASRLIDGLFPLMRVLWVDDTLHAVALSEYRAAIGSASLVDRASFLVMRANVIDTAFAFDTDFEREGFKLASTLRRTEKEHRLHEEPASYGDPASTDPVGVAEISARAGRSVNTVQSWRRRHDDFPAPLAELAAGPIWSWPTVADWIASRAERHPNRHRTGRPNFDDRLPGADLVRKGLADLSAGRESVEGLLLQTAPQRLAQIGIVPPGLPVPGANRRMYELIEEEVGAAAAHSRYNALRRRLVSFLSAAGNYVIEKSAIDEMPGDDTIH